MTIALFFVLVALGVLAAVCVLIVVPSYWASITRYELWKIRDDVAGQIRHGGYSDLEQPRRFLSRVETSIDMAGWLSFLFLWLFNWLAGDIDRDLAHAGLFDIEKMSSSDREKIVPHVNRVRAVMVRRVMFRSWSGLIVGLPLVWLTALTQTIRSGGGSVLERAKRQTGREVPDLDRSIELLAGKTHRNLSALQ